MSRLESRLPLLLAVLLGFPGLAAAQGVGASQASAASEKPPSHKYHSKKSAKPEEPPLPPYVAAPLSPLPLEDMPAIPPQVLFRDGQLTIVSENSTLVDILREVRKQTGAEFEMPPGATERVVTAIGPGPARDVLATLLNGTHFNYVMVGSTSDPTVLERVVLTPKPTPGTEVAAANGLSPRPAGFNPGAARRLGVTQSTASADDADADSDMADQADDTDSQPAEQPPAAAQGAAEPTTPSSSNVVNTPQGPKTPEQLLQELQQRIETRRQLQDQQNKSAQPAVPSLPPTTSPPDQ
ncbi:MAG TPA: hypothetical protein VEI01_05435 [Terriglobales bacterium]|nr:hypothetical protein [Terriglobales bacterium]